MSIGFPWVNAARARRQILNAVSQAKRVYHPKSYPGRVTVFRATKLPDDFENGVESRWARLAAGGLETHLIPAYFAHTIYEPRVRVLAEKLAACLDRA
jgi:aspartate racemase